MEPNDEQLMGLMPQQLRDDLATVSRMAAHGAGPDVTPGLFEASLTAGALQFVRVALAHRGHQPALPVEGEEAVKAVRPSRRQLIMLADDMGMASVSEAAEYARAALAQPEPEVVGPSLEEVEDLCEEHCFNVEGYESIECLQGLINDALARYGHPAPAPAGEVGNAKHVRRMCEIILGDTFGNEELDSLALLVGHHPDVLNASLALTAQHQVTPAPAKREVEELVAWLSDEADQYDCIKQAPDVSRKLRRAAELLEQRHPEPVPVSERLPGPEDCDAEGRCWVGYPELTYSIADTGDTDTTTPEWRLEHQPLKPKGSRCCWLPATALPLPAAEVRA